MKKHITTTLILLLFLFFVTGMFNNLKSAPLHPVTLPETQLSANMREQERINEQATIAEMEQSETASEPVSEKTTEKTEVKESVKTEPKAPVKKTCPKPDPESNPVIDDLFPVSGDTSIDTYIPADLVDISTDVPVSGSSTCITKTTRDAIIAMFTAMQTEGLEPIFVSGYRSYSAQKKLYDNQVTLLGPDQKTVAKPKHSEHQLGTTFDIKAKQSDSTTYTSFGNTPEYAWMVAHAHEYGFIQSYQLGKESINGYTNEPWHWRYVGKTHATIINTMQTTLVEYLRELNKPIIPTSVTEQNDSH